MAYEDYSNIEFGVGVENGNNQADTVFKISVDESVKVALYEMKESFDNQYSNFPEQASLFELSEKYSSTEHLFYPLVQQDVPDLFHIYHNSARLLVNTVNFAEDLPNITYYFAIFTHRNRTKTIGVKRPSQFKGLLHKKVLRVFDDSLEIVDDNLFKLDTDFDFFINETNIDILHPNGFLYISKLDERILGAARQLTIDLGTRIAFVNFAHIAPLVEQSKTAARLISSIRGRVDLERTNEQKLVDRCIEQGVNLRQVGNQLVPDDNDLVSFLQVLDRRLYDYDLTDAVPEKFFASSRSPRR